MILLSNPKCNTYLKLQWILDNKVGVLSSSNLTVRYSQQHFICENLACMLLQRMKIIFNQNQHLGQSRTEIAHLSKLIGEAFLAISRARNPRNRFEWFHRPRHTLSRCQCRAVVTFRWKITEPKWMPTLNMYERKWWGEASISTLSHYQVTWQTWAVKASSALCVS